MVINVSDILVQSQQNKFCYTVSVLFSYFDTKCISPLNLCRFFTRGNPPYDCQPTLQLDLAPNCDKKAEL